jgi:hypothetical protein
MDKMANGKPVFRDMERASLQLDAIVRAIDNVSRSTHNNEV